MISKSVIQLYLDSGVNVIPVRDDKRPAEKWTQYQHQKREAEDLDAAGLGAICGKISDNLEVIDIDQKYSLKGSLLKKLEIAVEAHNKGLWDKLVVQQTKSGGWHLIYRCDKIEGNLKLARRRTVEGEGDANDRIRVLFETRGEGGYILTYPSKGYKMIKGKWSNLPRITPEERDLLHACCRSFDETIETFLAPSVVGGIAPWTEYDEKNKCEDILLRHGWSVSGGDGQRIYLRRPNGKTPQSGNVMLDTNRFWCWSTSTPFDTEKNYSPSGILCILEYNGDWSELAKRLYDEGYGKRPERTHLHDLSSFIVNSKETQRSAELFNSDQIKPPSTLGFPELDKFLVLRDNCFSTITGGKASGKTTTLTYIFTIDAYKNKTKTFLACFENDAFEMQQEIVGFLCHNNAKWVFQNQRAKYDKAVEFFNEHFTFLKFPLDFNFFDITKTVREINSIKKHDRLLIDPLFKVPDTDTYEKNRKIAQVAKNFTENELSVWCSMHPTGRVQREGGQPKDLDAEFGGVYSNAADFTMTMARNYKSEDEFDRRTVRVSIDKVRSKKLYGGNETFKNNEILFEYRWKTNDYRIWSPKLDSIDEYEKYEHRFDLDKI